MGAVKKFKLKRVITGGTNNAIKYWGKFQYVKKDGTREDITLTQDYEVIRGNAPMTGKKIFEVNFQKFGFEYEIIVDADNKKQQLFLEALRLDPKLHSVGALKTGHLYQLVDENYEAIQDALEIKKRANVTNRVYALGMEDLSKLCYWINLPINGLSKEVIYGLLLHPTRGKIFSISLRAENNYVDTILNGAFGSDFDVKSSVNKAIVLGIISQVNGAYYLGSGSTILGTSSDAVYAFFRENKAVYTNGLLPELESRDILPESIDYDGELTEVLELVKEENSTSAFLDANGKLSQEKREELLKRAEELKKLGYTVQGNIKAFSDSVLIEKITRAEGLLAQKQNM